MIRQKDLNFFFFLNKKSQVVLSAALGRDWLLEGTETGFSELTA